MGDVIDFEAKKDAAYDRFCGECGSPNFIWQTFEMDYTAHLIICAECEEPYELNGSEVVD